MNTEKPYTPPRTTDEVVAENLRRLRDERNLTRDALAAQLTENSDDEWSRWKIVDLEGARSKKTKKPPRPATWADLVALALALEVTIFDPVLPDAGDTQVIVSHRSETEQSKFPDDDSVPEELRGKPKTRTIGYNHRSDRDEMGKLLFGLPGSSLTAENLERIAAKSGYDLDDAVTDIAGMKQGLDRALEALGLITDEQQASKEND